MTVAARLLAILEAETAQFDARFTASATVIDKMTKSQALAHRATGQLRSVIQDLANQAAGTTGPLGRFLSPVVTLAGGAGALGAAAAVGVLSMAVVKFTSPTEDAAKAADALAASYGRVISTGQRLANLQTEISAAQIREQGLAVTAGGGGGGLQEGIGRALTTLSIRLFGTSAADLKQRTDAATAAVRNHFDELIEQRQHEIVLIEQAGDALAIYQKMQDGATAAQAMRLVGLEREKDIAITLQKVWEDIATAQLTLPQVLQGIRLPDFGGRFVAATQTGVEALPGIDTSPESHFLGDVSTRAAIFKQLRESEEQRAAIMALANDQTVRATLVAAGLGEEFDALVRSMNRAEVKSQQLAIALVTTISGAIQSVIGGGGIGSVVSGASGVLGALSTKHPALLLPSVILGGLGGIFNAFDRSEERRHRELVDAVGRLAKEVGLERVTVVFTGPDGREIRKTLRELEDGDAVERMPGPVGANG